MDKKSRELLQWEKKLEKEEELLAKSKRILNERKQKLNEAERKLRKKEKQLEDMQKNIDAVRMNIDTKEKELNALAKKLRDVAKVENNNNHRQDLLKEFCQENVLDEKNQEFEVKLKESIAGSSVLKGIVKHNNVTEASGLEKKKAHSGIGEGYVLNEGEDDGELHIFMKPLKTANFGDYFPRHALG